MLIEKIAKRKRKGRGKKAKAQRGPARPGMMKPQPTFEAAGQAAKETAKRRAEQAVSPKAGRFGKYISMAKKHKGKIGAGAAALGALGAGAALLGGKKKKKSA